MLELSDHAALKEVLTRCTTVLQLIGTVRARFGSGDTYETSDVGTTRHLVEAAKVAGIDHFILLSSIGAGRPLGAYLQAKARAEQLVRDSGMAHTIFRPSAFTGEGHPLPPFFSAVTTALGLSNIRPIEVEVLAHALLNAAAARAPLGVVAGDALRALA